MSYTIYILKKKEECFQEFVGDILGITKENCFREIAFEKKIQDYDRFYNSLISCFEEEEKKKGATLNKAKRLVLMFKK